MKKKLLIAAGIILIISIPIAIFISRDLKKYELPQDFTTTDNYVVVKYGKYLGSQGFYAWYYYEIKGLNKNDWVYKWTQGKPGFFPYTGGAVYIRSDYKTVPILKWNVSEIDITNGWKGPDSNKRLETYNIAQKINDRNTIDKILKIIRKDEKVTFDSSDLKERQLLFVFENTGLAWKSSIVKKDNNVYLFAGNNEFYDLGQLFSEYIAK